MPTLTPQQRAAIAADYDDKAATLDMLARRYAPDPNKRPLRELQKNAARYRARADELRALPPEGTA